MTPRTVNTGNGWRWITDGFSLFAKNVPLWIALTVTTVLLMLLVNIVPLLGLLAFTVCWPVITAGLMLGCRALERGEQLEIAHLLAGFKRGEQTTQLLIVGAIYLAATIVIVIAMVVAVFFTWTGAAPPGTTSGLGNVYAFAQSLSAGVLVGAALALPLMMAVWFAPPLIVFEHLRATEAMKLSFAACMKNTMPFLVYSIALVALSVLATLPLMLGLLVLLPVMLCSFYTNYQDIFPGAADATPPAQASHTPASATSVRHHEN